MEINCYDCTQPITNLNLIKCHLCERAAHTKCFGWSRSNLDFANGQTNLLWFCTDCLKLVENLKSPNASDTAAAAVMSSVADSVNSCMNEVKNELGQITAFIGSITDKLLVNTTPVVSSVNRRTKRPRVVSPNDTPQRPKSFANLICGTRATENFPKLVDTVPKPAEKFWLYLSRIAPHVSEDEIAALVQSCIPGAQPIVKKLIRKDADVKSFAFISFKIGLDLHLKNTALDASNWPKGIYFRPFEERNRSMDFWEPYSKFPRTTLSVPAQALNTPMN